MLSLRMRNWRKKVNQQVMHNRVQLDRGLLTTGSPVCLVEDPSECIDEGR